MKSQLRITVLLALLALLGLAAPGIQAQSPFIKSLNRSGLMVCSNLAPGSVVAVEWSPGPKGPWSNAGTGLDAIAAQANGTISVTVPMLSTPQYYRLRVLPASMVAIPVGNFVMGNCMDPGEGWDDELPLHSVAVSAFHMEKYEVTKALWDDVCQWATNHGYSFDNAGSAKATNHPVQSVSWHDCVKWCNARSQKEGLTPCYYTSAAQTTLYQGGALDISNACVNWAASGYRLPTEAEWEKAARGGASGHRFPWSDADTIQHARANYYSSTNASYDTSPTRGYHPTFNDGVTPYTSPSGYFAPNGYGIYDFAGNVAEWCWDWYDNTWYGNPDAALADTHGPAQSHTDATWDTNSYRVVRDGSWENYGDTRCSYRDLYVPSDTQPYVGFRCVRGF
jgi:formylglycine-generating enzyme required for sulfatase activity